MSSTVDTAQRFFRPADVARVRRNQRRIQIQHALVIARNVVFVACAALGALWIYRQTHSDARFAVRTIEVGGVAHTPKAAVDAITRRYVGANLFEIDIASVQRDLRAVPWIQRISIEKKLPDVLRINVVERTPVALLQRGGRVQYVDEEGVILADVTPSVGDDDLPLIGDASGSELVRTVVFLRALRASDGALYSRLAEIRPVPPRGFAVFDRELGATLYLNSDDAGPKWRALYGIAATEQLTRSSIEYADLRFAGRIVLKPRSTQLQASRLPERVNPVAEITN